MTISFLVANGARPDKRSLVVLILSNPLSNDVTTIQNAVADMHDRGIGVMAAAVGRGQKDVLAKIASHDDLLITALDMSDLILKISSMHITEPILPDHSSEFYSSF